ncbi:MAG: hypothetical protein KDD51_04700 [Bdellovibrionales bacterium]|nr:hypothetical protein [Bdellovibrionales bacterium]
MKYILCLWVLLFGNASEAADSKALQLTLTGEQYVGAQTDSATRTELYADLIYKVDEQHTLRALQGVSKLYEVSVVGESEVQLGDLFLYHYWKPGWIWEGIELSARSSVSLPVSEVSRRHGVVTRPAVRLEVSRRFLNDHLLVSYRPFVRYSWNRFTSTPDGAPLPLWTVGHGLYLEADLLRNVKVVGSYSAGMHTYEQVATGPQSVGGDYEIDVSLAYQLDKAVGLRVGVNQADDFFKEGRFETNLYDPQTTRYYLGVDVAL